MYIVQYWNDARLPPSVLERINSFKAWNPGRKHLLFNEDTAAAFIREHFGAHELSCFRACAVPAMQSDYLRLCAVLKLAGFYADADMQCLKSLQPLVDRTHAACFFCRPEHWIVPNGFFYSRFPELPLLRFALEIATTNVQLRIFDRVWMATGPSIISTVYGISVCGSLRTFQDSLSTRPTHNQRPLELLSELIVQRIGENMKPLLDGIRFEPFRNQAEYVAPTDLRLSNPTVHWTKWPGSIYR